MLRALISLSMACVCAWSQQMDGQMERVTGGMGFVSSLAWSAKEGFLLVADGPGGAIRRIDTKGTTKWREGLQASGMAMDDKGHVYVSDGVTRSLVRIDGKGKTEPVAAAFEGKKLNGPGDVVVGKNGHVWFADPSFAAADSVKELPFYGIYHVSPRGEVTAVARLQSRPNGLALSPDGKTLFATVADERSVLAWSVGRNGETTGQRVFATGIEGIPAGLTVGPDGRVWVCARQMEVFSGEGKRVGTIAVTEKPRDCEFGEDGKTLFIAAGTSVYRWRAETGEK